MATTPEDEQPQSPATAQGGQPTNPPNGESPGGDVTSAGISIGGNATVGTITAQTVIGRDYVVVTEEQSFDVSDIPTNPYRGLASFTYKERAFYGGRDAQVREALEMLTTPGDQRVLLLVTGASGSGKSSFVQAGLVPAVKDYYALHGNPRVVHTVVRPGRFALAALTQALNDLGLKPVDAEPVNATLARTPEDQVNAIVLDQFEELFTQSEPSHREAVCGLLSSLGSFKDVRTHFLLTLRSDYLGALFGVKPLYDLSKHNSIELRAMTPTELAEAIHTPLDELNRQLATRKRWDPALVQNLCEDVGTDARLLPLLQVTLTSLWEDPPRRLVLGRYRNLTTALQATADRVYDQDSQGHARPQAERDTIMGIFLDLVEVSLDDDPRRDVRRTMPRVALVGDQPERGPLINELVDKRLLSSSVGPSDEARIDIIHETLLTNWSVLKAAITRQRGALQSRERFLDAKREWLAHQKSDDYRLQGVYLAEARALVAAGDIVTHEADARALIERSAALDEEERQHELEQVRALAAEQQARAEDSTRAARRLRRWLVVVVVTALLAIGAALIAAVAFVSANQQAQINKSRELAAESQAQLAIAPELAILLAREAEQRAPTQQAADALRQALVGSPIREVLSGPGTALSSVALSPDGSLVAAGGLGSLRIWRVDSGAVLADIHAHAAPLVTLAFSPDGQTLLTASADDPSVRAWNASTGEPATAFDSGGPGVSAAATSPSGRWLAAGSKDGRVRVWEARSGQVVGDLAATTPLPIAALVFDSSERRLAIAGVDGVARVWLFTSGANAIVLRGHAGPVMSAAFSPSGDEVLTAGFDGTARVWPSSGGSQARELRGGTGPLSAAVFSPDGRTVLTADQDGHAWLWSAEDGRQLHELRGHTRRISSASFSPAGAQVLTTSDDASARLWDVATGAEVLQLRGHSLAVNGAQFSRDGRTVVTAGFDKLVRVWDVAQTPSWTMLSGHTAQVVSVALSSDGQRVATASLDNSVQVWQPGRSVPIVRKDFDTATSSVAFAPDGQRLAFGLWDGTVHLAAADLRGDTTLGAHADWIYSVQFSPDGARLLSASKDRTARIWSVGSGEQIGELRGHASDVTSAAWDLAGRRIVTASVDRTARVWNADTFAQVAELRGHTDIVRRAVFSPDGRRVASAGYDATVRIWEADNGTSVTTLHGHTGPVLSLAFSPDGKLLASGSVDRSIVIWDTATWQPITSILGADDDVDDLTFSRDGGTLAAASGDSKARLYSREWFAPIAEVLDLSLARITRQPPALTADERARFVHD